MAKLTPMSPEERGRISAAVSAAEGNSAGEIVTIVADKSDSYHDAGLHYAITAMLVVFSLIAAFPDHFSALFGLFSNGWVVEPTLREVLTAALVAMILTFLLIRYALAWMPLRLALTPHKTKARRVRRRAVALFRVGTEARTIGRTGILIYLSAAERIAEIVADEAIHSKVEAGVWGDAMAALVADVKQGRVADGMIAAVERVGVVLAQHLPRAADDRNELPDRIIEL
jgi:putative membrane protein